jgi:hypothetical protein
VRLHSDLREAAKLLRAHRKWTESFGAARSIDRPNLCLIEKIITSPFAPLSTDRQTRTRTPDKGLARGLVINIRLSPASLHRHSRTPNFLNLLYSLELNTSVLLNL